MNIAALDKTKPWPFKRRQNIKIGSQLSGGDVFGEVPENSYVVVHVAKSSVQHDHIEDYGATWRAGHSYKDRRGRRLHA